jgi:hypothetical protein
VNEDEDEDPTLWQWVRIHDLLYDGAEYWFQIEWALKADGTPWPLSWGRESDFGDLQTAWKWLQDHDWQGAAQWAEVIREKVAQYSA